MNIGVFSCKGFNYKKAVRELKKMFDLDKIRACTLERYLEYSDIGTAKREINFERPIIAENSQRGNSETTLGS